MSGFLGKIVKKNSFIIQPVMFSMNELFFTLSLKKWKIFTEKHIPVSEWVFEIAKSNSAALGFNSL